jgi:hydrogenase nickel incorporation protein HypA/HybF
VHELSVASEIIRSAVDTLERAEGVQPLRLCLRVGQLSGLNADNLRFCLEVARGGTPLENVEIAVENVRPVARCAACGEVECSDEVGLLLVCPRCGGRISGLVGGDGIEMALDCDEGVTGTQDG